MKVDAQEMQELLKLTEHIKARALLAIEQSRGARKQALRNRLGAWVYELRVTLDEIASQVTA